MARRRLFGGAMLCVLPPTFVDASTLREVPDNQEVWVDTATDASLIVECVEYQTDVQDADSATFFLDDLAQLNESRLAAPVQVAALLPQQLPHLAAHARFVTVAHSALGGPRPVELWVADIRLPHVATDLLVTLHQPSGGDDAILLAALGSLQVVDWSLFGH